jgi:hypothetical protein
VDRIQRNFEPLQRQVELWRKTQITDDTAKLIFYSAFIDGKLEAPRTLLPEVHVSIPTRSTIQEMQMPVLPLEERTALDPEDFFQSFLLQNRPVIIRGAIARFLPIFSFAEPPRHHSWRNRTLARGPEVVARVSADDGGWSESSNPIKV